MERKQGNYLGTFKSSMLAQRHKIQNSNLNTTWRYYDTYKIDLNSIFNVPTTSERANSILSFETSRKGIKIPVQMILLKMKKDLRSTKFLGKRSTTPISYWALKKKENNTHQSEVRLIGKANTHNANPSKEDPTEGQVNIQLDGKLRKK